MSKFRALYYTTNGQEHIREFTALNITLADYKAALYMEVQPGLRHLQALVQVA